MSHGHSKTVCGRCDLMITQCRCMSKDKTILYDLCKKCKDEVAVEWLERNNYDFDTKKHEMEKVTMPTQEDLDNGFYPFNNKT